MEITDLTGSEIIDLDIDLVPSIEFLEDSNINVFEFANVLLAGLLPMLVTLVNVTVDLVGTSVSEIDVDGQSPYDKDSNINATEFANTLFGGLLKSITNIFLDKSGSILLVTDEYGSSVLESDVTQAVLYITDFLSSVNEAMDVEGTSLSISEWGGNLVAITTVSELNTTEYDFIISYNDETISYDGLRPQGLVVDISGT